MAARETLVVLMLPWKEKVERLPTKKAARARAEDLVRSWIALDLEVTEDADGDFVVHEVTP